MLTARQIHRRAVSHRSDSLGRSVNRVAQAMGMEQALALEGKMCETTGAARRKVIKEQAGIEELDARAAHQLLLNVIEIVALVYVPPTHFVPSWYRTGLLPA
jgi:hypothetical protein